MLNSAEIATPFHIELANMHIGPALLHQIGFGQNGSSQSGQVELHVSLHLAFNFLCRPRVLPIDLGQGRVLGQGGGLHLRGQGWQRVLFDINVGDLPRATRVLFRLVPSSSTIASEKSSGNRKGPAPPPSPAHAPSFSHGGAGAAIGWTASTLFDFKGCMHSLLEDLHFFPGDVQAS